MLLFLLCIKPFNTVDVYEFRNIVNHAVWTHLRAYNASQNYLAIYHIGNSYMLEINCVSSADSRLYIQEHIEDSFQDFW